MIKYTKTTNPNIVLKIETIESEIYLDKLEVEIRDLENNDYASLQYPHKASVELKQAIDMYNEPNIACQVQNEELLEEKKELLNKYRMAK